VQWIEDYCRLYEGDFAGQPFRMLDWQREITMRIFGWVFPSSEWGRDIRRFRKASVWVPKKNGKSPLLAAWGLYLLIGDSEPGQKVYAVAKDGGQAMISFKHAMTMCEMSPELMDECEIKKGGREGPQIIHVPSRSVYKIVAGDNPNSQEGLNGSVMVDETHVVDRRLMRILRGAGISRSEPLQIEVSTAGNNPDGYGKAQFDYGAKVLTGEVDDRQFFYEAFAAEQQVSDEELANNIEAIGVSANPSWGHTIKSQEFLSEYNRSKVTPSDFLDFKMYRLNIWQASANPFLPAGSWELCKEDFDESELSGMPCYAALDLSLKWDTTAFVMLFPWETIKGHQHYRLLTYFWLPQKAANEQREIVSWYNWQKAGAITITDGDTTDFPMVKDFIIECGRRFAIRQLLYDERFAQTMCQELQDQQGMTVAPFGQSPKNYTGPMDQLLAMVVSKRIKHNGNPVMSWQAGNLSFKETPAGKRPVKPEGGKHLKIDGPVALLMATGGAMLNQGEQESVYKKRGAISIGDDEGGDHQDDYEEEDAYSHWS
jgi:phage terminase large subunit-like protein